MSAESAERLQTQIAPALQALIAVALHRDAAQAEAVNVAALRRSDELKTALLQAVSHDLRTPVTAIHTAGHALGARSLTDDERAELSLAVIEESDRLSSLIDKLLDLSQLQAGGFEPRAQPVAIEEVLLAAREGLPSAGGEVRLSVDPDTPAIHADPVQLERAFANLIENGRRYSGGLPVSVRARAVGTRLIVRVVDRGPGIAPSEQRLIFEPFYRGDRRGAPGAGSGLGLAIARGFIEANGGAIAVESLPGQGTSFVVTFPLRERASVPA